MHVLLRAEAAGSAGDLRDRVLVPKSRTEPHPLWPTAPRHPATQHPVSEKEILL